MRLPVSTACDKSTNQHSERFTHKALFDKLSHYVYVITPDGFNLARNECLGIFTVFLLTPLPLYVPPTPGSASCG